MPNVNLIAARREEKRNLTTLSRQLFLGFVASAAVLVLAVLVTGWQRIDQQQQLNALDDRMKKLQPKLDEIKHIESDMNTLKPKVETLDNARLATLRWRGLMSVLADSMPTTVWVTNVSTNGDLTASSVNLKGIGPSQAIVGEVATRLNQQGIFDRVDIVSTSNGSAPEDPVQKISFEMNAFMRAPVMSAPAPATPAPAQQPQSGTAASSAKP